MFVLTAMGSGRTQNSSGFKAFKYGFIIDFSKTIFFSQNTQNVKNCTLEVKLLNGVVGWCGKIISQE
jgi:hypothetical protein